MGQFGQYLMNCTKFQHIMLAIFAADLVSISSTFYAHLFCQYFFAKKLQSQNVTSEKLLKAFSYEKFEQTMLMKLTIGFTNIFLNLPILQLRADFDEIT